jgi:hypothetical protein
MRTAASGPTRRDALALTAAGVLTWSASATQLPPLPPFSTAAPGPGLPTGWAHETLPKVQRANMYAIELDDGVPVLRVRARASASSLVATLSPPAPWTRLRWRWKVSRSLAASDLRSKAGDDYAARLYVLFDLPLAQLPLADRLRLQAARSLSGRDLPAASLCYVWGGEAQPAGTSGWNPYTDRVRMVVVDSGTAAAGRWRPVERDLRQDWQAAFGGAMPAVRAIAVGADTDNAGESVEASFGDVELFAG